MKKCLLIIIFLFFIISSANNSSKKGKWSLSKKYREYKILNDFFCYKPTDKKYVKNTLKSINNNKSKKQLLKKIEKILKENEKNDKLKYISILESNLEMCVKNNHSSALGLWQFLYPTGKEIGLCGDNFDYRCDLHKSTVGFVNYVNFIEKEIDEDGGVFRLMYVIASYYRGVYAIKKLKKNKDINMFLASLKNSKHSLNRKTYLYIRNYFLFYFYA